MTRRQAKSYLCKAGLLIAAFISTVSDKMLYRLSPQQYFANARKPLIPELTFRVKRNTNEVFLMNATTVQ
jgi:hypothetical protein